VDVAFHHHHHYRSFAPNLEANALVVAFPVIGWKPPWPLFWYLLAHLPPGREKAAYVIYTSAGGPENTGWLMWLILTFKGYRVLGRSSAVYPVNIPTVRLGSRRLWQWYDRLLPRPSTLENQRAYGRAFAEGRLTGLPLMAWPTPLPIIGMLTDNKWIDMIYRNHAFRKRCTGCGLCVRFCPTQRLVMRNGRPKAKGTCAICLGCVNICPTNAIHLWFFTEFGRPYRPRWPELLMRGVSNHSDLNMQPEQHGRR
jgi:ferredoxin